MSEVYGQVFRPVYRELSVQERAHVAAIKDSASELYHLLQSQGTAAPALSPGGREFALARTKLEESVMWAVKAITG